ncbi:MAG: hypothetical protein ACRDHJ_09440, partial [Actinomycetota bacterium]
LMLFAAAFLEFLGYHQILAVERLVSMFQIRRKRGIWGQMRRTGAGQVVREAVGEADVPVGSKPARL